MRRILLSTLSAASVLAAAPALAEDCQQALLDYNETAMSKENYRSTVTPGMQIEMRRLRDAAIILANAGQEEACHEVVVAIKDMAENPEKTSEQLADAQEWNSQEVERLKAAKSLDQVNGQLRVEEVVGSDVRNKQNDELGEIDDILLATKEGDTSYAIVSHGGFIGIGEKQIAVPMDRLMVTADKDVFVLDVSEEQLESAPSFERGKFETISDESWRRANDEYFAK